MAYYYRDEDPVVVTEDRGSGIGSNIVWAITTLLVVIILAWVLISSGVFRSGPVERKIDIDVKAPAVSNSNR